MQPLHDREFKPSSGLSYSSSITLDDLVPVSVTHAPESLNIKKKAFNVTGLRLFVHKDFDCNTWYYSHVLFKLLQRNSCLSASNLVNSIQKFSVYKYSIDKKVFIHYLP